MQIAIVADANVILSALLGGKPSLILFDSRFEFVTTEFTISEVEKYIPMVSKKLSLAQKVIQKQLEKLPLKVYEGDFYQGSFTEAKTMIEEIDKKDVDILALAIELETYLWSQDKDFEEAGYSKLLKTHDFFIWIIFSLSLSTFS